MGDIVRVLIEKIDTTANTRSDKIVVVRNHDIGRLHTVKSYHHFVPPAAYAGVWAGIEVVGSVDIELKWPVATVSDNQSAAI